MTPIVERTNRSRESFTPFGQSPERPTRRPSWMTRENVQQRLQEAHTKIEQIRYGIRGRTVPTPIEPGSLVHTQATRLKDTYGITAPVEEIAQVFSRNFDQAMTNLQPRSTLGHIADKFGAIARIASLPTQVIAHAFPNIPLVGNIDALHESKNVAIEGLKYQAATGKNPNVRVWETVLLGGLELGASAFFTATVPVEGPLAFIAESGVDTIIGEIFKFIKYPTKKLAGHTIDHQSVDHAVRLSGIVSWLPVAPTLAFMQWFGRYQLRQDLKRHPEKIEQVLIDAASLGTLHKYEKQLRRK